MRIGYAYPFKVWPADGGNKIHAYQLIKCFLKAGHEVVTLGDSSMDGLRAARDVGEFLRLSDVAYLRVDAYPLGKLPDTVSIMRDPSIPIVVELNSPANEMLAFSWLGGEERPSSGLSRALDTTRRRLHALRQSRHIRREEKLRQALARRWDVAICVSKEVEAYAKEALGMINTLVLPNASDPEVMNPQIAPAKLDLPADQPVIFFAGSPKYPWQGLRLLGTVIQRASQEGLPMVFLLVGHHESRLVPELPNVRSIIGVPYPDMAAYINAADVCVSLQPEFFWSPWGFHGSPTKLFDYMACGKPVLASNVGQMREVISHYDCGILCAYNPDDVLEKLLCLVADPVLRRRLGANGRRAVEKVFNWDSVANSTMRVFESLLPKG